MLSDSCLSVLSVTLVYCGQTDGWIKMKFGMQVGMLLHGDRAPPPQRGTAPSFRPISVVEQMAECIEMPLGRKVGLGPSDIVLDKDIAPSPQKLDRAPIFGPCLL